MSFAADDTEAIRRRLEEIEAERKLALTGTSAPAKGNDPGVIPAIDSVYGDYACGFRGIYTYE